MLSPNSIKYQKKGLHQNLKGFFPISNEDIKRKVFTAIWYYVPPNFGIHWCWQPLFLELSVRFFLMESAKVPLEGDAEISMGKR